VIAANDYAGIVNQAWNIVQANYVRDNFNGVDWDAIHDEYLVLAEEVETQEELWVLLDALIDELGDDHSRFVPPARMDAEFGVETQAGAAALPWTGIRVWPAKEDEQLLVWCVSQDGPGAAAGVEKGDVILAIDGETVVRGAEGWTREQYTPAMFGNGGSSVTLTIQQGPGGQPRDVNIQLGGASGCDGWTYGIVNNSPRIGYLRVLDFDGNAAFNILQAIEAMESTAPLDGLIVDVRHNPGGNSDESIKVFAEGVIGTVGALREDSTRTVYRIRGPVTWNEETPVVVLTDGNSHSAADYFPAGMKVLGRATIIGMPSAGNTEGIISFNLADGTLIRLAVSALLLEDGTSIEGVGVEPDIRVPLGEWGLRETPFDVQLQAAIDHLLDELN
jgi:C-terminal peptidase prc